ncbi:MAG: PhoU domain-containing protein [Phycisphaerae bacterium]|nr:PhoU domain-containing protein [Phycisphaerae bacterium]
MLSRILELWRGKSLVSQMVDEFMEMLRLSKSMFDSITEVKLSGGDVEGVREDVFAADMAINRLEQSIRRKIVVHLSVQSDKDVSACLILMSVAKDAERLGDYTKNVFEVFRDGPDLEPGLYYDQLLKLCGDISAAFANVADVFKNSDAKAARQLKESNYRLEKQCDAVINELLGGAEVQAGVAYALLFRFFKRILGHMSNIVSSVVMPVDKIDYFEAGGEE